MKDEKYDDDDNYNDDDDDNDNDDDDDDDDDDNDDDDDDDYECEQKSSSCLGSPPSTWQNLAETSDDNYNDNDDGDVDSREAGGGGSGYTLVPRSSGTEAVVVRSEKVTVLARLRSAVEEGAWSVRGSESRKVSAWRGTRERKVNIVLKLALVMQDQVGSKNESLCLG